MRVTRLQAEANRQRVIDVAGQLFREHGYDGIGLKDVMNAAGLTQGGFYKQFDSKDDLIGQATARAVETSLSRWSEIIGANPDAPLQALAGFYLSPEHRDRRGLGCPLAALASDAPRHVPAVQATFDAALRAHLQILDAAMGREEQAEPSMAVGGMVLARMTGDESLSGGFLRAAAHGMEEVAHPQGRNGAGAGDAGQF